MNGIATQSLKGEDVSKFSVNETWFSCNSSCHYGGTE